MNDAVTTLVNWVVRCILIALGLLFFLGLLAFAALLIAVWSLRVLWASLTGGPAVPRPQVSPRQGFSKVYRYGQRGASAEVTDVEVRDIAPRNKP